MLLGTGLSCFYFLPALYHSRYFPVSRLPISLADNLLHFGGQALTGDGFMQTITSTVISTAAFIVLGGAVALWRGSRDRNKQTALWMAVSVAPILLMWHLSFPLWVRVPSLFHAVQFPWRINIVLCLAALPIAAALLSDLSWPLSFSPASSIALALLFAVIWLAKYGEVSKQYAIPYVPRADEFGEYDGWFKSFPPVGTNADSALEASTGPRVRFLVAGSGAANVLLWRPRHVEFETDGATGGSVMINQFYYPEWTAEDVGEARSLHITAALPQGLLEVQVPPGHQRVRLDIPVGIAERLGVWVSALCVMLCLVLVWKPKVRA
jgi:hypothetical protein